MDDEVVAKEEEADPEMEHTDQYLVEAILDVRTNYNKSALEFFVKWEGYPHSQGTWENEKHLRQEGGSAVAQMIDEFKAKYPEKIDGLVVGRKRTASRKRYELVERTTDELDDLSTPKHIKPEELYGDAVALTGEAKKLVDPNHLTSSKELRLAKIVGQTGTRVTRAKANELFKDTEKSSTSVSNEVNPVFIGRNNIQTNKKAKAKKTLRKRVINREPVDDIFTTEDNEVDETDEPRKKSARQEREDQRADSASKTNIGASTSSQKNETIQQPPTTTSSFQSTVATRKSPILIRFEGLPVFPVRTDISVPTYPKRIKPLHEEVMTDTIVRLVKAGDEIKMARAMLNINKKQISALFDYHEPSSKANLVHLALLSNNKSCNLAHTADGVIRIICHEMSNGLLLEKMMPSGNTPLHMAAEQERPCTMQILINYNPDLSIKNSKGQTALDIAIEKNNFLMVKYLLEAGANYTESFEKRKHFDKYEDKYGNKTALHALQIYTSKLTRTLEDCRSRYFLQGNLEHILDITPIFQQPGYVKDTFEFSFNFTPYQLPNSGFFYLLFIYMGEAREDGFIARCWGEFNHAKAPELNGEPMMFAQNSNHPMIFLCPMVAGRNSICIFEGSPQKGMSWKKSIPTLYAQVYLVAKKDAIRRKRIEELPTVRLEQTPLIGPI